ncbi:hypothetical protein F5Y18DRAFT_432845 [Xylariaceae sp. FL1019]|nr:hypothetical protein F5Y18DRAFT_432845 [Xylariaceae sp. FL1019]
MILSTPLTLLLATTAYAQVQTCTAEMVASDDCAAVIDANACYNEFRWNAQTLQCIDGTDNADRQRKKTEKLEIRGSGQEVLLTRSCKIGVRMLQLRRNGHV